MWSPGGVASVRGTSRELSGIGRGVSERLFVPTGLPSLTSLWTDEEEEELQNSVLLSSAEPLY